MFTYLDPNVRRKLDANGTLIGLDSDGNVAAEGVPPVISVLGPIPLPLERHGRHFNVRW
jgi:hypothetical protein